MTYAQFCALDNSEKANWTVYEFEDVGPYGYVSGAFPFANRNGAESNFSYFAPIAANPGFTDHAPVYSMAAQRYSGEWTLCAQLGLGDLTVAPTNAQAFAVPDATGNTRSY